ATATGAGSAAYGVLCLGYTWAEAALAATVHGMLMLFLCEAVGGLVYLAQSAFGKSEQTP
ncbi:MAG TPA: hypothetical protein VHB77_20135, partial [Planctomycetaceae bacterium]|nr:hypothetical protein [Planctomycetaceae bacterium]